jgi:hypothetical protein
MNKLAAPIAIVASLLYKKENGGKYRDEHLQQI